MVSHKSPNSHFQYEVNILYQHIPKEKQVINEMDQSPSSKCPLTKTLGSHGTLITLISGIAPEREQVMFVFNSLASLGQFGVLFLPLDFKGVAKSTIFSLTNIKSDKTRGRKFS